MCVEGACSIDDVYLPARVRPSAPSQATFASSDERLNRVFRQPASKRFGKTLLIFSWTVPRASERAGSATAFSLRPRGPPTLDGNTLDRAATSSKISLLPEKFAFLPDGMLADVLSGSDHYDGVFIPNWAMWFVVQLEEYQNSRRRPGH